LALVVLLAACAVDREVSPSAAPSVRIAATASATATSTPTEPAATVGPPPSLRTTVIQTGLEVPWDIAFAPDGRMLVTERRGQIRVFASAEPGAEELAVVPIADVLRLGEGGGMGLAVDRDFAAYPFVYVCATRDFDGADGPQPAVNELLRYRLGEGGDLALDGPALLTGMRAHLHHDGCAVETDDDGHIWLTMGDSNTARDEDLAQDPNGLNGRVLRINRDGSIPNDNPILSGATQRTAAYTMGQRNPQGIAFRSDGLILTVEHGTDRDDEINRIVPGGNYGYACWSATDTVGPAQEQEGPAKEGCGPADGYLPAAWASGFPTLATSGGVFLPGEQWGAWKDSLIVSTLKEMDLRRFAVSDDGASATLVETLLDDEWGRLRAVVIGPDGWLYVSTANVTDDKILRVEGQ
jgi:glucose/arabinose dehydrogenase